MKKILNDLWGTAKDVMAVEIDENSVKMAYGMNTKQGVQTVRLKSEFGRKFSDDEISSFIKKFAEETKFSGEEIISIVPAKYGVFKNLEIPSIDRAEIKQIVDLQTGAHTPYPKSEIIIDHIDIGVAHERYTKILLLIVKKEVVSRRYDLIRGAGYGVSKAVLSPEVEARAFSVYSKDVGMPVALVDIDAATSLFTVVKEGKAVYVRSIPCGASEISMKGDEGISKLCSEVKRSVEAYQAGNIEGPVSSVYFTGNETAPGRVVEQFSEKGISGIKAGIFDLHKEAPHMAGNKKEGHDEVSLFSLGAYFASPEGPYVDLTPEDALARREIRTRSKEIMRMGIFATAALLLFCVTLLTNMMMKHMYLSKLQNSYTEENRKVEELQEVMGATSRVKRFIGRKGKGLTGMAALFHSIPGEVYLTNIDFDGDDTFVFTGTADSMSRVFSLVTELENSRNFRDVKIDFTRSRSQRGKEVADFGLTLTFMKEME